ncbi:MAG: alkaline phosphatase, partial [Alteromonadales bacterium]|nr:alkaline phosphatase [Alteromonadales bacterium]
MNFHKRLVPTIVTLALSSTVNAAVLPDSQTDNAWFQAADNEINQKLQQTTSSKAKNVILFVGDGMGISTLTAARILEGQLAGNPGEENQLSFEAFPYSALVKTYNVDAQTPDSAGTMSAMMSGVKTDAGVIGLSEEVQRGRCNPTNDKPLASIVDLAEVKGLATGIVTTARITHATPAATYAQSPERNWEDISDMPEEAITAGCTDIAQQLVNYQSNL